MNRGEIRLLLVEDESRDARLIGAMLGAATGVVFEVEVVDRLSLALSRLAQQVVDVVLLDLSLPDSRGLDTFTKLQSWSPDVPVVVMSGLDDQVVAAEAVEKGAQDYLIKGQVDQGLLTRALIYAIERGRAERALRDSEKRFRDMIESLPVSVFEADLQGNIVYANCRGLEVSGYSQEDIDRGLSATLLFAPEEVERLMQNVVKAVRGEVIGTERNEYTTTKKDGGRIPVILRTSPIVREGELVGVRAVVIDITDRKQAEEAVKESEEKYRGVVERANDGIILLQDTKIQYANQRVSEICGYGPEEVFGTLIASYVHPDELPKVVDRYKRRLAGEDVPPVYETVLVHKDGHKVDVELNAGTITYQGKPADLVIIRDVSQRKKAEDALREAERRYRAIFDNPLNMMLVHDEKGLILEANDAGMKRLGYTPEDLGKVTLQDILYPDDALIALQAVAERMTQGRMSKPVQVRVIAKSGEILWLDEYTFPLVQEGEVYRGLCMAHDITERKRAEEALQEAEKRYRAIFDNPLNMVNICDERGIFLDANDFSIERLGYMREDLGEVGFQDLVHPEDLPRVLQALSEVMAKGYMDDTLQIRMIGKSGEILWLEVYGSRLEQDKEHFRGLAIGRDITEAKKAEEALKSSEEKLRDLVERLRLSQEALSTPVVQLWDNVLALPLIGVVDEQRAQLVMEVLLRNIVDTQSELVILDVTGVAAMDSQVASYIMQTVRSASLLGAKCILTGIRPEVAQTVIELGLDIDRVVIKKDMREGLRWALQTMGYRLKNGGSGDHGQNPVVGQGRAS